MADKPRSREKNVTGNGTGLYRRGEGLNQSAPTSGSSAPMGNGGSGRKGHGGYLDRLDSVSMTYCFIGAVYCVSELISLC